MSIMAANQNRRKDGYQQEAWPKRVPYFDDEQIIQCTACRHYFATDKAWKAHRRAGTCNPTHLIRNDLGIWQTPVRRRVQS